MAIPRSISAYLTAGLIACVLIAICPASAAPFEGPYRLSDGITFYIVNPSGGDFDATVRAIDSRRVNNPGPVLIRVFDTSEKMVEHIELPGDVVDKARWEEAQIRVAGAGPGVYQIIVTGLGDVQVDIELSPALEYGLFGHLQYLCGTGDQFGDAYVYLPPGLEKLSVAASQRLESLVLSDADKAEKLALNSERMKGEVTLPGAGEHIWRLSASGPSYRLDFGGVPIILCPSVPTAAAIKASVDIMPDGTVCFHKHQVRAWRLLQEYKKRPASDYAVEVVPIEQFQEALLRAPARNQLLFGHYGVMSALPAILSEQCLDPQSPWFGAIDHWRDDTGVARTNNPMADYARDGREGFAQLNKNLAALYWLDDEFSPYHRNPQLLNRIIVGALLDLLVMREGEYLFPTNIYYYGNHGFALLHSHSGAFSLVYNDVPPEVQEVWHAGQQRVTDRYIYGNVGGCTNQWTVLLAGLWRYYEATGEPWYRDAIIRNTHWLTDGVLWNHGVRAAGYMTEASGPDATYNGITGHYLSWLYHETNDEQILKALRDSYNLFNHTIAPEPAGQWLGSSGYCHRTPGDWVSPQYGAGLGPMSKHLPEAGVRYPDHAPWAYVMPATDGPSRAAAEEQLKTQARYFGEDYFRLESANHGRASGGFDISLHNWRSYGNSYMPGKLPMEAEDSFTRNVGDEFFCVRRPGYYAFIFGARDYGEWQSGTRPKEYNHQFPHNDGLCMFWSPEFGVSLLSKNWGAAQGNTLLADLGDDIQWPYYWATESSFDTENATVTLTGTIHKTPLRYERVYRFLDDRVECSLTVTADEAISLEALSECIPFPLGEAKPGGLTATPLSAAGLEVASGSAAKAVHFGNESGEGHIVVLAKGAVVDVGQDHSVDHYGGEHDWGRVLIALPRTWAAGQSETLTYAIMPCAKNQIGAVLK